MSVEARIVVVSNRFPGIAGQLQGRIDDAMDTAVLVVIAVADPLTRRDTGALVGNKTIERTGDGRTITWNEDYAAYQNGGTVYMIGTHFAEQGMDAATPPFLAALANLGLR